MRDAALFDDDFGLAMFLPDGSADPAFGSGGVVVRDLGSQDDTILSLAAAPGGKLIASGMVTSNGVAFIAVARFEMNGSLDATFGTGGVVLTPIHASFTDQGTPLAVLADGSLLVAGNDGSGIEDFALLKLDANGAVDASFGNAGMATVDIFGHDYAYCLAVDAQDRIVLAGGDFDLKVARFEADGTLDTTFGTMGSLKSDVLGRTEEAVAIAIREDGRIVVLARALDTITFDLDGILAGFTGDGAPDPALGPDGYVTFDFGPQNTGPAALAVQENGLVVIAGTGDVEEAGSDHDFFVLRFRENGALDGRFGIAGRAVTDFGDVDEANAIAISADGRIIVAGSSQQTFDVDFALARYLP